MKATKLHYAFTVVGFTLELLTASIKEVDTYNVRRTIDVVLLLIQSDWKE